MTAVNLIPVRSFPNHKEMPEEYYTNKVRHDWSRAKNHIVTCKICGMKINMRDKIYNLFCPNERLEVIERLKEINDLLNNQPSQQIGYSKKYVTFYRKDWNKWIKSIKAQLRKQEE